MKPEEGHDKLGYIVRFPDDVDDEMGPPSPGDEEESSDNDDDNNNEESGGDDGDIDTNSVPPSEITGETADRNLDRKKGK